VSEAPVRLCFVCLGNICRSPTAWGVMKKLVAREGVAQRFVIDSAGTAGYHAGDGADPRTVLHAKRRGVDLAPHRARQFGRSDFARFDYVLAADADNVRVLQKLAPDDAARAKIHLLRAFEPSAPRGASVPDPYYGGSSGFDDVLDICERACRGLLEHMRVHHAG